MQNYAQGYDMSLIESRIRQANLEGRAALIGYWPVGYPDLHTSILVMHSMVDGGCDIIEAGIPHHSPPMDGPVIREAGAISLANGFCLQDVVGSLNELKDRDVEILIMGYWDSINSPNADSFAEKVSLAGTSGIIIPDMDSNELTLWEAISKKRGLDNVCLVNSGMSSNSIKSLLANVSGFIYAAVSEGSTGTIGTVGLETENFVSSIRRISDVPICLGIGISDSVSAAKAASIADGVIVGSEFIRRFNREEGNHTRGIVEVRTFASELAESVRRLPVSRSLCS